MKNLRTLAWLAGAAILVAAFYAGALRDRTAEMEFEDDDERAVAFIRDGDQGAFRFKSDALTLEAEWRGDFTLTEDGADMASLDGKLKITSVADGVSERAIFEPRRDGVRKRYFRNDEEAQGAEAEAGAASVLAAFLKVSGVAAEQRIRAVLKAGGADAALAEISALKSDTAARRYILALNDQYGLSADDITALSDTLEAMEDDQDLRVTLSGLLETDGLETEEMLILLRAAGDMESGHDIRKLIESAAAAPMQAPADEAALREILKLYERLDGGHDLRKAGEALLESKTLSADQRARVLAAAGRLDDDRGVRLLLAAAAPGLPASAALRQEWFERFADIEASREQRLALKALAGAAGGALVDDPDLSSAYRSAALSIGDADDRADALAALERAADGGADN